MLQAFVCSLHHKVHFHYIWLCEAEAHFCSVFVCVSVCVCGCVTTCTGDFLHFESNTCVSVALRLFFLSQMKNGNVVYDLLLTSSAKIFPRSVHLSLSFTSRLADDPARRLPRFFSTASLRFPSHGWSSSEWHYLSAVHCSHVPPLIITGAHM